MELNKMTVEQLIVICDERQTTIDEFTDALEESEEEIDSLKVKLAAAKSNSMKGDHPDKVVTVSDIPSVKETKEARAKEDADYRLKMTGIKKKVKRKGGKVQ